MRLRYTRRAAQELQAILAYIAVRSPGGATRVQTRIQTVLRLLARRPYAGSATSKAPLRRMVASPYPYLIYYQVTDDEIIVHGIRHAARRPVA